MTEPRPTGPVRSELALRVMSAIVMALAAVGATIVGGWPFFLFWALAAAAVAYEWQAIIRRDFEMETAAPAIAAAATLTIATGIGSPIMAAAGVMFAAFAVVRSPAGGRGLAAIGIVYAAALGVACVLCRGRGVDGVVVIFWLFAVVWGTDTLAYFTGRKFGGPKLWPRVSPKKTWSGAIGGLLGGVAIGLGVLAVAGYAVGPWQVLLSILFSCATQGGDLFESSLKRRFDVKDASHLIPGHGGVMDRLDGFIFAVVLAATIGLLAGGGIVADGLLAR